VNYDKSLVVAITVTCYSWAPSRGDHLFSCGAISRPPHATMPRFWHYSKNFRWTLRDSEWKGLWLEWWLDNYDSSRSLARSTEWSCFNKI